MMLLDVVRVEPKQNHVLLLEFDNGERRQFDMSPYLKKPPFWSLSDTEIFAKASVAYGTVVWPGEIDISPDTLYDKSVPLTE